MAERQPRVFVITAFGKRDSKADKESRAVIQHLITPAIQKIGFDLEIIRGDDENKIQSIMRNITNALLNDEIIVAILFPPENGNVFYELGIGHSAGRRVIMLKSKDYNPIAFDIRHLPYIEYDSRSLGSRFRREHATELVNRLAATMISNIEEGQFTDPLERKDLGRLGQAQILPRFNDFQFIDWSKMLVNAEREIIMIGNTLAKLLDRDSYHLPTEDGELRAEDGFFQSATMPEMFAHALAKGVNVTIGFYDLDSPALMHATLRDPAVVRGVTEPLEEIRNEIRQSLSGWPAAMRAMWSETYKDRVLAGEHAGEFKIVKIKNGYIPQRITMTEKSIITSPIFHCSPAINGKMPAIRADADQRWHSAWREEISMLLRCNEESTEILDLDSGSAAAE